MGSVGIHFMALPIVKERLVHNEEELKAAKEDLAAAAKFGDLRENSEYDNAKTDVRRLNIERGQLIDAVGMPVVKSPDNLRIIEEGSVVSIRVYSITPAPIVSGSKEFEELKKSEPIFEGVLMYGATLSIHELLRDNALSENTPVGKFIYGKTSGDYSVPVKGNFVNVSVEKLPSGTDPSSLYTKL